MNKIAKITGWILGLLGLVLGGWCLASGDATNTAPVDVLLRFTYIPVAYTHLRAHEPSLEGVCRRGGD